MRRRNNRHNRRIDNTQLLRPVNPQVSTYAPTQLLGHHRAAAARVREGRGEGLALGERGEDLVFCREFGSGGYFFRGEGGEGGCGEVFAGELDEGEDLGAVEGVLEGVVAVVVSG